MHKNNKADLQRALYYIERSFDKKDKDYKKYLILANIYMDSKKENITDKMIFALYDKAIELNPKDLLLRLAIGLKFFSIGQNGVSLHYLENAINNNPKNLNDEFLSLMALNYSAVDKKRGRDFLSKMIKNHPTKTSMAHTL